MALKPNVAKMRDLLLKARVVDELQMRSALARLDQWGGRLPKVIADMGFVDEQAVTETLSKALKIPVQQLGMVQRDGAALSRLDPDYCEEHAVFPISLRDRTLTLAMADPTEIDVVDLVASKVNARVSVVLASETQIRNAIAKHYRGQAVKAGDNLARRAFTSEVPSQRSGEASFELDDAAPPPPGAPPPRNASANTMLDEMFGDEGAAAPAGFTQEELTRLDAARLNQQKTAAILRALQELLAEKGFTR